MSIINILQQNSIFQGMSEETLRQVEAEFTPRSLRAGEVLFNMGDPGSEMLLIQSGRVAIYSPEEGHPEAGQAIRIFGAGDVLGEMALIDGRPRSTSARAEGDTVVLALSGSAFLALLDQHRDASTALLRSFSEKIRYTTDFITEMRGWVRRMDEGNYQAVQASSDLNDSSLAALAAEFIRMARHVREREDQLRQEVALLRIEIDEKKRKQEVQQITESDYYQNLKAKLRALREQDDEE